MYREIKFRGKRSDTGEWIIGSLFNGGGDCEISDHNDICYGRYDVIPDSVGQLIGVKDKNGTLIFEGDIVRWDDMSEGSKWRVAVVEINPDIQFRIVRINCDYIQSAQEGYIYRYGNFAYKDTENYLEIIGNIHDNPDLLC